MIEFYNKSSKADSIIISKSNVQVSKWEIRTEIGTRQRWIASEARTIGIYLCK